MKSPISNLLKHYYKWKVKLAKRKVCKLSTEEAKVELDFKSLHILPEIRDYTLYLNPNDEGLSVDLYAWRFREAINSYMLFKFISEEKRNIDTVVDIGSNIGYFPVMELASGARQVIAIEPVPETYTFLKSNLSHFKNSKTVNIAISDKKETLRMYVPTSLNLATVLTEAAVLNVKTRKAVVKEIIDVQALSLKDIVNLEDLENTNILVRMDVEGFEKNIIKNLPKEAYCLSFELHSYILGYEGAFSVIKKLRKSGYKIRAIVRESGGLSPIIKMLGITTTLQLYGELAGENRILWAPSLDVVKDIIKQQKECPHIYAIKS